MWQTAPLFSVSNQVHQIPIYVADGPTFSVSNQVHQIPIYVADGPTFSVSNQVHQIPIYVADGPTFFSIKSSTPNTYICGRRPHFFQYQIKYTKYLYMWQTAPLFFQYQIKYTKYLYMWQTAPLFSIKSSTPNTYICGDGPTFSNVCYLGYLNFKRTLFINNGTKKRLPSSSLKSD